ncbi:cytidylate kinase [bacterium BMS3Abin03]|nr:cytidylate kinase [bacterium BMS3Abin03]
MAIGSYEKCKEYIESHTPKTAVSRERRIPYPCVTISRETGAGVQAVCKHLISILEENSYKDDIHWTFFDRKLIEKVLEDLHLPKRISEYLVEDKYRYISSAINELLGLHPTQWTILHKTTETVLQLARMGKAVIVGRGGNIITSNLKNVFHVRLIAPIEKRIDHVMEIMNLNNDEARAYIKKEDTARKMYLKSNFGKDVSDPLSYHIVLNTGMLSYKEAAEIIASAVMKKFPKFFVVN